MVAAGQIARETGFKEGEAIRVFSFGYVAHGAAADPASLLDTAVTSAPTVSRPCPPRCSAARAAELTSPDERQEDLAQTETCLVLSLVKGSRFQLDQRSRRVIPASRAMRSSSDGHT